MTNSNPPIKDQNPVLKAKKIRPIMAVLKEFVLASDKVDSDPHKLDEAPAWVEKALFECGRVFMPGRKWPTAGEVDLEFLGEFIGRLQAIGKLHSGEIPMGAEMKAGVEQIERQAASLPQSRERTAREKMLKQDWQARVVANQEVIPNLIRAALDSSHEDALKFQKGLVRGMNLQPDELTAMQVFQRHTLTFWVLAVQWRRFSKCRSVGEIHRILCKEIGEAKVGSLKTFEERVARKIGMKVRGRGRPPEE